MNCPYTGSKNFHLLRTDHMPHSPSDLEQIYKNRFAGKSAYRQRVWRILTEYFTQWIPQNATVLDLGCGYCEFINLVQANIKYAMDLNPEAASRAETGIQVLQQDCSETWAIAPDSLDVVFTS